MELYRFSYDALLGVIGLFVIALGMKKINGYRIQMWVSTAIQHVKGQCKNGVYVYTDRYLNVVKIRSIN